MMITGTAEASLEQLRESGVLSRERERFGAELKRLGMAADVADRAAQGYIPNPKVGAEFAAPDYKKLHDLLAESPLVLVPFLPAKP